MVRWMAASPRSRTRHQAHAIDWLGVVRAPVSVGIGGGEACPVYQFAYWWHAGLREHGFRTDLADIALTAPLGVRSDPGYTP